MSAFFLVFGPGGYVPALLAGALSGSLFGAALSALRASDRLKPATKPLLNDGEEVAWEGPANHFKGLEAVGGRLVLTNERVLFASHAFNVQTHEWAVALQDVLEAEPVRTLGVVPNGLRIRTRSGDTERFVVENREAWAERLALALPA
jgi:hypothetical protein